MDQLTESAVEAVGLDVVHAHTDPFYNECRAYGRLIESGLNGSVAVRAHGYTTIPAQDVHELGEEFQVAEWIQDAEEHQYNDLPSNRQLFRVIVKDLIRDDVRLTHKILNKMRRDLLRMRAQGVYPMDIKLSNYKAGLLVDLSSAMTRPHFFLDTCRESRYERLMKKDLYAFDAMIEKAKVKTWVKANTEDYKEKLRPRGRNMKYPK